MSEEKMAKVLGLTPLDELRESQNTEVEETIAEVYSKVNLPVEKESTAIVVHKEDDELIKSVDYAKNNIEDMIEESKFALTDLLDIAKQSQNPRAYEVVSTLMKTIIDANKDYVAMVEKKKFAEEDTPSNTTNITNNNLILSTADLLKMMKGDHDN